MDLTNKTVVVTGAGRGIGRALALEFASQGANVICAARTLNQVTKTVSLIENNGGIGIATAVDVTNKDQIDAMISAATQH